MRAKMYCVSAWQSFLLWEFSDPLFSSVVHTVHGREKEKRRELLKCWMAELETFEKVFDSHKSLLSINAIMAIKIT